MYIFAWAHTKGNIMAESERILMNEEIQEPKKHNPYIGKQNHVLT